MWFDVHSMLAETFNLVKYFLKKTICYCGVHEGGTMSKKKKMKWPHIYQHYATISFTTLWKRQIVEKLQCALLFSAMVKNITSSFL